MLTVPDVRQAEDYDCGAAAVDSVCKFYGVRERGPVRLANPIQGMDPQTVEAALRSIGFRVLSGTMNLRDLKHFTDTGRPVLCPTAMYGGHWCVVGGVARLKVTFMDSAVPRDLPNPRTVSAAEWTKYWRDTSRAGHDYDHWGMVVSKAGG